MNKTKIDENFLSDCSLYKNISRKKIDEKNVQEIIIANGDLMKKFQHKMLTKIFSCKLFYDKNIII